MISCPVCRAQLDLQRNCLRCGLTTESMFRAAQAAFRLRQLALISLHSAHFNQAVHYATAAQKLHRCAEGANLQWLITLFAKLPTAE